jgi:hypothetical protein
MSQIMYAKGIGMRQDEMRVLDGGYFWIAGDACGL